MFSFQDLVLGNADFANLKITKYFGNLSCSDLFAGYFSVYVFCLVIIHIIKFLCTVDKLILSSHRAICHFLLVVSHRNICLLVAAIPYVAPTIFESYISICLPSMIFITHYLYLIFFFWLVV